MSKDPKERLEQTAKMEITELLEIKENPDPRENLVTLSCPYMCFHTCHTGIGNGGNGEIMQSFREVFLLTNRHNFYRRYPCQAYSTFLGLSKDVGSLNPSNRH